MASIALPYLRSVRLITLASGSKLYTMRSSRTRGSSWSDGWLVSSSSRTKSLHSISQTGNSMESLALILQVFGASTVRFEKEDHSSTLSLHATHDRSVPVFSGEWPVSELMFQAKTHPAGQTYHLRRPSFPIRCRVGSPLTVKNANRQ